jgi:transcription initiation factor IIF auxiliary subunit
MMLTKEEEDNEIGWTEFSIHIKCHYRKNK